MPEMIKTSFDPVPAGTYLLQLADCVEQENSKDRSKTFFRWAFEIMNACSEQGRTFSVLTPSHITAKSTAEKILVACGAPEIEVGEGINTDDYVGMEFFADVTVEQTKDKTRYKNNIINARSLEQAQKDAQTMQTALAHKTASQPVVATAAPQPEATPAGTPPAGKGRVIRRPATAGSGSPAPERPVSKAASGGGPLAFPK